MKPPTDSNGDLFLLQALRLKPVCQNGWSSKSSALSIDGYPSCQFTCLNANGNADDTTKNKMNASVYLTVLSYCGIIKLHDCQDTIQQTPKKKLTVFPGCYTQLCFFLYFPGFVLSLLGLPVVFRIPKWRAALRPEAFTPPLRLSGLSSALPRNVWSPRIPTNRMDIHWKIGHLPLEKP